MIKLFIDTSSADVSIAIIKDNEILFEETKNIPNEHSIYTTYILEKGLKKSKINPKDIDKILVVTGPGSFTGLRIGVTIAKVYAYLLDIKVICVSSLKMRSISFKHNYCLSLIDAHHNNYYFGLYDKDNNCVIKEQFNNINKLLEIINKYNPDIVSNENIVVNNKNIKKMNLDILKIINYYNDEEGIISHLVVPNYLKLPQVLEEKK